MNLSIIIPMFMKAFKGACHLKWIIIFLMILPAMVFAQPDPPVIHCISVESNGNITLTYTAPVDTGTAFGGYFFSFSSSAIGPFSLIDSVFNYSTLIHTITGVNANAAALYFYITTREGCCNIYSLPSDTLRSIRMIVTSQSNESVKLNWNRIHIPSLTSTVSTFILSKELTAGVYTTFKNTIDTTILDTNYFCSRFINYKVTQGDAIGCQSVSSIDGELFRDTKGPSRPLLDTVSINNTNGNALVSWFPDSSSDTQGYVIYQFNGISYDSIGTVNGINNTFFNYILSQSLTTVETFSVAAFDSCKNLSPLANNHSTMLLSLSYVKCAAKATLNWTPYVNMNDGLQRYEIWVRENGGVWMRDGFVPASATTYTKTLTQQAVLYEFFIRAVGIPGQTASSNIKGITSDIFQQPKFLYIRKASVTGSTVKITCFVDTTGDVISYKLYRSNNLTGPFSLVTIIPYNNMSTFSIIDAEATADMHQVFYKFSATDSCGLENAVSNIAGTAFLTAEGGNDFISHLSWIDYFGWQNVSGSFKIYRVVNGFISATPFATISGDTLFYNEDVSGFQGGDDNNCYTIEAVEDSINIFGFKDSAMSNIACALQSPAVYIPNAFTPDGKNPVFKPVVLFEDPSQYLLRVFNRWGLMVFETANPKQGWSGKYNDKDAIEGLYVYILVFKGFNKKEIRRTGTVLLLR